MLRAALGTKCLSVRLIFEPPLSTVNAGYCLMSVNSHNRDARSAFRAIGGSAKFNSREDSNSCDWVWLDNHCGKERPGPGHFVRGAYSGTSTGMTVSDIILYSKLDSRMLKAVVLAPELDVIGKYWFY